ncbi:MAG: glycosyltransferase [Chitinophagaceae bacterium]
MIKINENHVSDEKIPRKPRILVAPLDWGLGHATRCIPVIYELLKYSDVWLAGEGAQQVLLTQEFPGLPFLPLRGYRVKYSARSWTLPLKLILQSRRLLKAIKEENEWLKNAVKKYQFDAVIADNRFGLYHDQITSVFITHQLALKTPLSKPITKLFRQRNYRFINRFTNCWVPDEKGENNLAGELSHPVELPEMGVEYIGPLSRLTKTDEPVRKKHLFISLSGPEPQRSIFENKIINDISHYNGTATIVRGLPGESSLIPSTNDIRFYNHLPLEEYNKEMQSAEFVISRSGYSTIMDLARVGRQSILVATPGQPEQEYLAAYLAEKGFAYAVSQKKFSLNEALHAAQKFNYRITPQSAGQQLTDIVHEFISRLEATIYSVERG